MYDREAMFNTIKEEKYKELKRLEELISKIEFLVENTPNDMDLGRELRKLLNNNE